MSNFDRTGTAKERTVGNGIGARRLPMPKTDEFWQYAKEALLSASSAESDDNKKGLLELAQTWTRAAILERQLPAKPTAAQA